MSRKSKNDPNQTTTGAKSVVWNGCSRGGRTGWPLSASPGPVASSGTLDGLDPPGCSGASWGLLLWLGSLHGGRQGGNSSTQPRRSSTISVSCSIIGKNIKWNLHHPCGVTYVYLIRSWLDTFDHRYAHRGRKEVRPAVDRRQGRALGHHPAPLLDAEDHLQGCTHVSGRTGQSDVDGRPHSSATLIQVRRRSWGESGSMLPAV